MALAIALREDDDAGKLGNHAKRSRDPRRVRRLLSPAAVHDGLSREAAAAVGGMDRRTPRDWAHRFNEDGPNGLTNRKGAGRPRLLTEDRMQTLAEIVESGPDPEPTASFAGGSHGRSSQEHAGRDPVPG